jgi:hypothetical protein
MSVFQIGLPGVVVESTTRQQVLKGSLDGSR